MCGAAVCFLRRFAFRFAEKAASSLKRGRERGEAEIGLDEMLEVAAEIGLKVVGAFARRLAQVGRKTHAEGLVPFFWMNGFPHGPADNLRSYPSKRNCERKEKLTTYQRRPTFAAVKPSVPDSQKSQGVSFSLKPDLYQQLLKRVEQLGYPWTKSSYVTKLVIDDLAAHGLWPSGDGSAAASAGKVDAFVARKNAETARAKAKARHKSAHATKH